MQMFQPMSSPEPITEEPSGYHSRSSSVSSPPRRRHSRHSSRSSINGFHSRSGSRQLTQEDIEQRERLASLFTIVHELYTSNRITYEEKGILKDRTIREDEELLEFAEEFFETDDVSTFSDRLVSLVRGEVETERESLKQIQSGAPAILEEEEEEEEEEEDDDDEEGDSDDEPVTAEEREFYQAYLQYSQDIFSAIDTEGVGKLSPLDVSSYLIDRYGDQMEEDAAEWLRDTFPLEEENDLDLEAFIKLALSLNINLTDVQE